MFRFDVRRECMRPTFVGVALTAGLTVGAPDARAQSAEPTVASARAATGPGPASLGLGTVWEGLGGGVRTGIDVAAQAAYERRLGASRAGVRLEGSYLRDLERSGSTRWNVAGVGLAGTYALARGRVQPYLLAGAGVAHLWYESTQLVYDPATGGVPAGGPVVRTVKTTALSPTLSGGAGVVARVGPGWAFVETRLNSYARATGSVGRGAAPLLLGWRF